MHVLVQKMWIIEFNAVINDKVLLGARGLR